MATDLAAMPVNGSFAPHQQAYANSASPANHAAPSQTAATSNNGANAVQAISQEEVGWYFVERYYTTLSKKPDNLYVSCRMHDASREEASERLTCTSFSTTNGRSPSSAQKTQRRPCASASGYVGHMALKICHLGMGRH